MEQYLLRHTSMKTFMDMAELYKAQMETLEEKVKAETKLREGLVNEEEVKQSHDRETELSIVLMNIRGYYELTIELIMSLSVGGA